MYRHTYSANTIEMNNLLFWNISETPDTRSARTVLVTSCDQLNRAVQADQPTRDQPQEMEEILVVNNQH